MKVAAVIPARMGSTRLPGKALADIGGRPMVVRVLERALAARCFDGVYVATDHAAILAAVRAAGGEAVLTRADHPSGSDRVWEVVERLDVEGVVNVQGDEPFVDPALLSALTAALRQGLAPVVTVAAPYEGAPDDPARVKVRVGASCGPLALDFSRAPFPGEPLWLHQGLYAYTREALARFVSWPPGPRERAERLEQLRLLEHGVPIGLVFAAAPGLSVDTPEDLDRARTRAGSGLDP